MRCKKPSALFLFAHQDDEFGVFQKIIDEVGKGRAVYCVYFTDGRFGKVSAQCRNQESLAVLLRLGVKEKNIFFIGYELSIPDGRLSHHLDICADWITKCFSNLTDLKAAYVLAWEGGHQDHDALHAVTVSIADEIGILGKVWQFSLYNGYHSPGPLFKVFQPVLENGVVNKTKISLQHRFRFLYFCLSYPSQAKTWLGLFPFVMFHYLFNGTQMLQPVSRERIFQRPHKGKLLYEKRGFFTWEKMEKHIASFFLNLSRSDGDKISTTMS